MTETVSAVEPKSSTEVTGHLVITLSPVQTAAVKEAEQLMKDPTPAQLDAACFRFTDETGQCYDCGLKIVQNGGFHHVSCVEAHRKIGGGAIWKKQCNGLCNRCNHMADYESSLAAFCRWHAQEFIGNVTKMAPFQVKKLIKVPFKPAVPWEQDSSIPTMEKLDKACLEHLYEGKQCYHCGADADRRTGKIRHLNDCFELKRHGGIIWQKSNKARPCLLKGCNEPESYEGGTNTWFCEKHAQDFIKGELKLLPFILSNTDGSFVE